MFGRVCTSRERGPSLIFSLHTSRGASDLRNFVAFEYSLELRLYDIVSSENIKFVAGGLINGNLAVFSGVTQPPHTPGARRAGYPLS